MVFVVDIGDGTYDTAVVYLDENLNPEIIGKEGDRSFGGNDLDKFIIDGYNNNELVHLKI